MRTEYIEKQALRDKLYEADAITLKGAKIINQFPPADVRVVVRGYWRNLKISVSGNSSVECSQCGAIVYDSFSNVINYCPKCGSYNGADMRGGETECPE